MDIELPRHWVKLAKIDRENKKTARSSQRTKGLIRFHYSICTSQSARKLPSAHYKVVHNKFQGNSFFEILRNLTVSNESDKPPPERSH